MAVKTHAETVRAHYDRTGLTAAILEALEKAGKDVNALTLDDLAPMEEFHIGGRKPTLELGRLARLSEGMQIVDVGCGIGGPARALACHFGCDVLGVDLSEAFCEAAVVLNERTGMAHKVSIRCGSALDLPVEDDSADVVWMQHVGMNIRDKAGLLREIGRVLRPQGRLALYEVFAGSKPAEIFPVPWASGPEMSFLVTPDEAQGLVQASGFRIEVWDDVTREATPRFRGALEKAAKKGPPPISLATLMGPEFPSMAANILRSLEEDRLRVVRAVLRFAPPVVP